MLTLDCMDQVYCDGLLTDDAGSLLFMSVWGRDTAISQFLARLTLPDHPDGIGRFIATGDGERISVSIPNAKLLDKEQGRASRSLFGDLVQLFVFAESLRAPDRENRAAWVVYRDGESAVDIWPLMIETCHVPLLPQWRDVLVPEFQARGWITQLTGYRMGAIGVQLGDPELESCIEHLVQAGALRLSAEASV
ncbi:MAG: hypothetical protein NVV73_07180 [Cellvibrionaceae bacterium]|nr:hypothetical protein [Cellvibrionaceae bacterium]